MADITDYLAGIRTAQYGKDVRESIASGIEQCYADGKAGAVDLTARANVAALAPRVTAAEDDIDDLEAGVAALTAAVGSPLVAATAAGMTDTTKIYVYTGSETGYTNGNWYYYDGSAWASGGVYNSAAVQTDTTLSVSGTAADAAAVGTALAAIPRTAALSDDVKAAILACFAHAAWIDDGGQGYYDGLEAALYPPADLSAITAVFAPGAAAIYTSNSLDDLRAYLTVTAVFSDQSTRVITNYTLSGTLAEGTNTITAAYGGKSASFTVTAEVFTTSPRIAAYDKTLDSSGAQVTLSGACVTEAYEYELPIDDFKETQYYDSTNDYCKTTGALFRLKYCLPNTGGVSFSSRGKNCIYNSSDSFITYGSPTRSTSEGTWSDPQYTTEFFTLSDNKIRLKFTLATADVESSYAYWTTALHTGLLPVGVTAGDIIFAGEDTPYYGLTNISEATS